MNAEFIRTALERRAEAIKREIDESISRNQMAGHICKVRPEEIREVDFLNHLLVWHTPLNEETRRFLTERYVYCALREEYGDHDPEPELLRYWP